MSKIYTVPTIEWDGTPGEITVDELRTTYLRQTIRQETVTDGFVSGDSTADSIPKITIDKDLFVLHRLLYQPLKRSPQKVELFVYVHDAFCKPYKDTELRQQIVEQHVDLKAPWYFSYGRRL